MPTLRECDEEAKKMALQICAELGLDFVDIGLPSGIPATTITFANERHQEVYDWLKARMGEPTEISPWHPTHRRGEMVLRFDLMADPTHRFPRILHANLIKIGTWKKKQRVTLTIVGA